MKKWAIAFALTLLATTASAASVVSIFPNIGTVNGGDFVTITVDTPLHACNVCSPPTWFAEVTFAGIPSPEVQTLSATTLRARTPAHAFGTVDVVVTSQSEPYGTTKFRYAGWGGPIDLSNYEKVLVPLALPSGKTIPGAFGSQWATELWVSNGASAPVEFFQDITCTLTCPLFLVPEPGYPQLAAKKTVKYDVPDAGGNVAYLYYLQRSYANDVHFSLHAADLSRSAQNAGTEVGIVRQRNFTGQSFDILNVPIDATSRATLRAYDTLEINGASVSVTIHTMDTDTLIAGTELHFNPPVPKPATTLANTVPAFAGYATLPDIRNAFAFTEGQFPSGKYRLHFELHGTSEGWALVSVTNNTTQLITTYRPE